MLLSLGVSAWMMTALTGTSQGAHPAKPGPALVQTVRQTTCHLQTGVEWLVRREFTDMLLAVLSGSRMGPGDGWFHPGQNRYGWKWLAERFDADHDGRITPGEFRGPLELFKRLDRNHDGVITAADLNWSPPAPRKSPAPSSSAMKGMPQGPPKEILIGGLLKGELGSPFEGPRIDEMAPDFDLPLHDGKGRIALHDFRGHKPVVLVFGSFT
jgi:Ca2+-binding EF-hand superfamily protein